MSSFNRGAEGAELRTELLDLGRAWRRVLAEDPMNARPIVSSILVGRITYTPLEKSRRRLTGEATLSGLFDKVFSVGMASPTRQGPLYLAQPVLDLEGPLAA